MIEQRSESTIGGFSQGSTRRRCLRPPCCLLPQHSTAAHLAALGHHGSVPPALDAEPAVGVALGGYLLCSGRAGSGTVALCRGEGGHDQRMSAGPGGEPRAHPPTPTSRHRGAIGPPAEHIGLQCHAADGRLALQPCREHLNRAAHGAPKPLPLALGSPGAPGRPWADHRCDEHASRGEGRRGTGSSGLPRCLVERSNALGTHYVDCLARNVLSWRDGGLLGFGSRTVLLARLEHLQSLCCNNLNRL